jgi:hypothetical protein
MKFMLLQNYAATEVVSEPMSAWAPDAGGPTQRPPPLRS